MKQPEKWKETINPFDIKFKNFKIKEILGYPHAQNDVFYVRGIHDGKEVFAFVKYASKMSSNIKREIETIEKLDFDFLPRILDFDKDGKFIITREAVGERLSYILKNSVSTSNDFMFEYGRTLAQIHGVKSEFDSMVHRKFFDIPTKEYLREYDIEFVYDYLMLNKPQRESRCFCHGDFHYANVLFSDDKKVAVVLDWELSGIGVREFDIAWALINRPGQDFLKTQEEVDLFLEGYKSFENCDPELVEYYMIQIYAHFLSVGKNNKDYQEFVKGWIKNKVIM